MGKELEIANALLNILFAVWKNAQSIPAEAELTPEQRKEWIAFLSRNNNIPVEEFEKGIVTRG